MEVFFGFTHKFEHLLLSPFLHPNLLADFTEERLAKAVLFHVGPHVQLNTNALIYLTIDEIRFDKLLSHATSNPFMVVFTADWLGEGTIMDTIIAGLAESYGEKMGFYRIDVDKSQNVTDRFGIRLLPAGYIFKNGEMIHQFVGMISRRNIEERVKRAI